MATEQKLTPTPYFVHLPDEYTDTEKDQGASWPLGAGFYEVGFEVNGARFPLARLHGGAVAKQFALAEAAKDAGKTNGKTEPEAK
jgi:hypothetical protein